MNLCILGSGSFGSAMAISLAKNAKSVMLWSRSPSFVNELKKSGKNKKYLSTVKFPNNVKITSDLKFSMKNASVIILCIPAQKIYNFIHEHHTIIPNIPIVLCSKGIDENTLLLQSEVIQKFCTKNVIAVLTGPSFADELAKGLPTALTLACENTNVRDYLQKSLSTQTLRLYSSSDIIGAQIGGSLKNVVAIGCGMVKGADLGESAQTALMTRGFSEIVDLGCAMGGNMSTFFGLSGLGDLALTCNSIKSRNFVLGLNYNKISDNSIHGTIEGIKTASAANKLANKLGVEAPVIKTIDLILKDKISLQFSIKYLLSRPLKTEFSQYL